MITHTNRNILVKVAGGALCAVVVTLSLSLVQSVFAETIQYIPLSTIPGLTTENVPSNPIKSLTNVYGVAIGIAAVLAVIMIIYAGMKYATEEAITGKSDAKQRIMGVASGLGLLLGAYLLLRTINIDLVSVDLSLGNPVTGSTVVSSTLSELVSTTQRIATESMSQIQTTKDSIKATTETRTTLQNDLESAEDELSALSPGSPEAIAAQKDVDAIKAKIATADATLKTSTVNLASQEITRDTNATFSTVNNALTRMNLAEVERLSATSRSLLQKNLDALRAANAPASVIEAASTDVVATKIFTDNAVQAATFIKNTTNPNQDGGTSSAITGDSVAARRDIINNVTRALETAAQKNPDKADLYKQSLGAFTQSFDSALSARLGCKSSASLKVTTSRVYCGS